MREFGTNYNGDIQAALRGLQKERMGGEVTEIDKSTRKRKWVASQEVDTDSNATDPLQDTQPSKNNKNCEIFMDWFW